MNKLTRKDEVVSSSEDEFCDISAIDNQSKSTQVSIQTLQGIYNELTGKSEQVGKSYSKPIRVQFSDIEELNHKMMQVCEQYNVIAKNCSATVYYIDDKRDQFSSFERFKLHNSGSASPVESILLKYHFLILLPKTREPQSYTVSIRLSSRVAVAMRMESEFYGAPPRIFRLMGNRTAVVEIEYIDYMVARNFLNLIDDWFKVIPADNESKILYWLQARSYLIPRIARFFTVLFVAFLIVNHLPYFIPKGTSDLLIFSYFLCYSLSAAYTAHTLASWSAGFIESSIDNYSELSFIKLTKGDAIEIEKAERTNKSSIVKCVGGLFSTISISVFAKLISNYFIP